MNYYPLLKPFIRQIPAELAHQLAVRAVACGALPAGAALRDDCLRVEVAGLSLPNPIGLAAGFDKNAQTLNHIFDYGFGFAECGTVTPKAQAGNPKPRLFRLPKHEAVINRLGFNNGGLTPFVAHLKARKIRGIVGANIGKNKDSADAVADYVTCLNAVYAHADYITVNISSPNTHGLRDLQSHDALTGLIDAVHAARKALSQQGQNRKPVFVKIAPDLDTSQQEVIAQIALDKSLDGLIVSNTTIARPDVGTLPESLAQGGLSGRPLFELSTQVLRDMYRLTHGKIPLIGVGGIASAQDAYAKIKAGASAVQLYTALVYQGFGLATQINNELLSLIKRDGLASIREAIGSDHR